MNWLIGRVNDNQAAGVDNPEGYALGMWIFSVLGFLALAFAIAILSTVLPSYMMAAGIQRINATRAGIIGSVGPVSTMVLGYFLLDEVITPAHVAGLAIVIASCLLLVRARA